MKKIFVAALTLLCASAMMVQAQDAKPKHKNQMTAEQKALRKEMVAKYDTNKNGKLDKSERAAMSKEDKDKLSKAGLTHGKKKKAKTTASTSAPADK